MLFYTIEFEDFHREKIITPKIPSNLDKNENDFLPRIILSPSIKLCMQNILQKLNLDIDPDMEFFVYSADLNKDDGNLFGPDTLYNERFVYQAYENKEYWYMVPLKMQGQKMKLKNFEREYDFAWKAVTIDNIYNAVKYSIKDKKVFRVIEGIIDNFEENNSQKLFYEITDILDENNMYDELEMFELFLARDWKNTIQKIKRFSYEEVK